MSEENNDQGCTEQVQRKQFSLQAQRPTYPRSRITNPHDIRDMLFEALVSGAESVAKSYTAPDDVPPPEE